MIFIFWFKGLSTSFKIECALCNFLEWTKKNIKKKEGANMEKLQNSINFLGIIFISCNLFWIAQFDFIPQDGKFPFQILYSVPLNDFIEFYSYFLLLNWSLSEYDLINYDLSNKFSWQENAFFHVSIDVKRFFAWKGKSTREKMN